MSRLSAPTLQPRAHNLFFAIRPPEEVGSRILDEVARFGLGGVPMRTRRLHVTTMSLVRDGRIREGLPAEACDAATAVRARPFRVIFDRLVAGKKSALLLPSEPLEKLHQLRQRLRFALLGRGLDIGSWGFRPHVTVGYGARAMPETEIDPIIWRVEDFVLIDSFVGETKHIEVGRWPLRA